MRVRKRQGPGRRHRPLGLSIYIYIYTYRCLACRLRPAGVSILWLRSERVLPCECCLVSAILRRKNLTICRPFENWIVLVSISSLKFEQSGLVTFLACLGFLFLACPGFWCFACLWFLFLSGMGFLFLSCSLDYHRI